MNNVIVLLLLLGVSPVGYGQVEANPDGQYFDYHGTRIYYEDTGSGDPLLLLHNFFNTADSWQPLVEVYAPRFRTIAIDMMGHGRSDIYKKDDININHAEYARMVLYLLDSLQIDQVSAIGASSGGLTLHHLNAMQPDRFKRVITVGAHIYYSKQARDWIATAGIETFMAWGEPHGPEKQDYLAKAFQESGKTYGDASFTPDILNTFEADWLVVLGDNDFVIPIDLGIEMYEGIPNSRLWIVPNGGHLPHLEPDIQSEFARVSLAFLTGEWD